MAMRRENLSSLVSNETTRKRKRLTGAKKLIEFYIPSNYQKRVRWIPSEHRGKLIEFCPPQKKTA